MCVCVYVCVCVLNIQKIKNHKIVITVVNFPCFKQQVSNWNEYIKLDISYSTLWLYEDCLLT